MSTQLSDNSNIFTDSVFFDLFSIESVYSELESVDTLPQMFLTELHVHIPDDELEIDNPYPELIDVDPTPQQSRQ